MVEIVKFLGLFHPQVLNPIQDIPLNVPSAIDHAVTSASPADTTNHVTSAAADHAAAAAVAATSANTATFTTDIAASAAANVDDTAFAADSDNVTSTPEI
eukprot:g32146.t1